MSRRLYVPEPLWRMTWSGLAARGEGLRETACVWGGTREGSTERAEAVVFLDDLPGVVGQALQHRTSRAAVNLLLADVRRMGLRIVGDVHTHPADWVDLSITDRVHPIEFRVGLIAIVIPNFACGPPDVATTGIHEYVGDGEWKWIPSDEAHRRVIIH